MAGRVQRRPVGGVVAAFCALACALAAHAFGVHEPARSLPVPEQQARLAALALARGDHADPGSAPAPRPGRVTALRTAQTHVVRAPATANAVKAAPLTAAATGTATGTGTGTGTRTIQSFVQQTPAGTLPPAGEATAFGCPAALNYLNAYAAPGFSFQCPVETGGHEATTLCVSVASPCDLERVIRIAEPCAAAYMNEASNSWVLLGMSDAPIDPYGACP